MIATSTLLRLLFLLCFCHNSLAKDQFLSESPLSFSTTTPQASIDTDLSEPFRSDKKRAGNELLETPSKDSLDQRLRNGFQLCENVPEFKKLLPCSSTALTDQFQVNFENHWFQLVCEGSEPAQFVTGPATPYQFPDKLEAKVFLQVQDHSQEVTKLPPATDFLLAKCGSKALYSLHEPLSHHRKLSEAVVHRKSAEKPIIVMLLSLDGICKSEFYQEMRETKNYLESLDEKFPVFHFKKHSLSASSLGNNFSAFNPFPHKLIWEAFKQSWFLTMANIEGCNVSWDASLNVDHVAYEFYCALDFLDVEPCAKERIAHETGFHYIKKFLSTNKAANLFISSSLKVENPNTLDAGLAGFIEELVNGYGDNHELVLIVEGSNQGFEAFSFLLATSSLLDSIEDSHINLTQNSQRSTSSIDLERTILKLAKFFTPGNHENEGKDDLLSSLVPLDRDCEAAKILPWLCLKCTSYNDSSLLQQVDATLLLKSVLKYINKENAGTPCPEVLEGLLTQVSEHLSGALIVQFILPVSNIAKFVGVFTDATRRNGLETPISAYGRTLQLEKVYRTDRSGNLCKTIVRGDVLKPDFCLC